MVSWKAAVYSVYQHWDPLKVCIVGRSWPPEFYSWIAVPHVRNLFEKIALETCEDLENLAKLLQSFGVEVLRPNLPNKLQDAQARYYRPPQTPRDYFGMIGDRLYNNFVYSSPVDPWDFGPDSIISADLSLQKFYEQQRHPDWPIPEASMNSQQFNQWWTINLSESIQNEVKRQYMLNVGLGCYDDILAKIEAQGNTIRHGIDTRYNTAVVTRIGRDLYHGTLIPADIKPEYQVFLKAAADQEFPQYRNHIVNTAGHSDGAYCPVVPGLIISLVGIQKYARTFPDWEVVYLPNQSWDAIQPFLDLKNKNKGKWWIPGSEYDTDVVDLVESWLGHWTGYVAETVFDVNMLVVDTKNVIVFNHNDTVFEAFHRHGITPHVSPLRHRYFWDGGIHCVTSDLHREGAMRDYFPDRF